jgi:hypothetical protein
VRLPIAIESREPTLRFGTLPPQAARAALSAVAVADAEETAARRAIEPSRGAVTTTHAGGVEWGSSPFEEDDGDLLAPYRTSPLRSLTAWCSRWWTRSTRRFI